MCIVDKPGKYELIICDKKKEPILSIDFCSISALCRILDEVDFSKCSARCYRKEDNQQIDTQVLLEIWRNE